MTSQLKRLQNILGWTWALLVLAALFAVVFRVPLALPPITVVGLAVTIGVEWLIGLVVLPLVDWLHKSESDKAQIKLETYVYEVVGTLVQGFAPLWLLNFYGLVPRMSDSIWGWTSIILLVTHSVMRLFRQSFNAREPSKPLD